MPSITDMLANQGQYGYLSGKRMAEEDIRTQEKHDVDIEATKVDTSRKREELEDYVAERKMRRKVAKTKEQQAERMIDNQDLLDEQYEMTIENSIADLTSKTHSSIAELSGRVLSGVKDDETFAMAVNEMGGPEKFKASTGIDPTIPYAKNKGAVDYAIRVSKNATAHQQAIELALLRANAAERAAASKGGKPPSPSTREYAKADQFVTELNSSTFWSSEFGTGFGDEDALSSDVGHRIATQLADKANSEYNKLLDVQKVTGVMVDGGISEAKRIARRKVQAEWHKVIDGNIRAMSQKEHDTMMVRLESQFRAWASSKLGEKWDALPEHIQAKYIADRIEAHRLAEYDAALQEANVSVR